ncbi:hypothetical protein C8J56DRAFT_1038935 [Mycena floridula]|nr:hypothetical protein C8J56DRAFT_1038935 [Mycena floridula]
MACTKGGKKAKMQARDSDSDYGKPAFDSTVNEYFSTPPSAKHAPKPAVAKPASKANDKEEEKLYSLRRHVSPSKQATPGIKAAIANRQRLPATTLEELTPTGQHSSVSNSSLPPIAGSSCRRSLLRQQSSRASSVDQVQLHPEFDHYPIPHGHLTSHEITPGGGNLQLSHHNSTEPGSGFHNQHLAGPQLPQPLILNNPFHLQNDPEYLRRYGPTTNFAMAPPPLPVDSQPLNPVNPSSRTSSSKLFSDQSNTAVDEDQHHAESDDSNETSDSDDEDDTKVSRCGRISDAVKSEVDDLISRFNQDSLALIRKHDLASNNIAHCMNLTPHGPKCWNQMQNMLKNSEAERKKWIKGYKPGQPLTRKQISSAYRYFTLGMGTKESDLYFQTHSRQAAMDPDQSRQSHHRTFINVSKAMERIATQMEASIGMNTLFISVGNTMEEDHSLVSHYLSPSLQEHFVGTWGKSSEEMASHVKAGLYCTVSKEVLIKDMRNRVATHDAMVKAKTDSQEVSTASSSTGALKKVGLAWPTNVVLWTDMTKKNVSAGVQILGWPHGMRVPGEFPDSTNSKKKSGFAHALRQSDKLIMKAAFKDPDYLLEFVKLEGLDQQALKDGKAPWIVFQPPPHNSKQLQAKRLFYPSGEDFEGPARRPPPAAQRAAKAGSKIADPAPALKKEMTTSRKGASSKAKKLTKRRDILDDIDKVMDQESYGTGSSSGGEEIVDRSLVKLRSRSVKVQPAEVEVGSGAEDHSSAGHSKKRDREDSDTGPEVTQTKRLKASSDNGLTPSSVPSDVPAIVLPKSHHGSQVQNVATPAVPPVQHQSAPSSFQSGAPTSAASFNNHQNSGSAYSGQSFQNHPGVSFNNAPSFHPNQPGAPFQQNPNSAPSFQQSNGAPGFTGQTFPMQNGGASFHQGGPVFNAHTGPGFSIQNPNGSSFAGQNQASLTFAGQNPAPSSFAGQNPAPLSFAGQNPAPLSFAGQNPAPSSFAGQNNAPSSFAGQNPTPSSFAGQNNAPSFSHGQNSAPSFINHYNHAPPHPSFNGQSNMSVDQSQVYQQPGFTGQYNGYPAGGNQPTWSQQNPSMAQSSNGAPHSSGYNSYQGGYQTAPQNGYTGPAPTGDTAPPN